MSQMEAGAGAGKKYDVNVNFLKARATNARKLHLY